MGNFIEVAAEIRVDNFSMPGVDQPVDMPHGIQRAAVPSIGILLRLQVGLEDRFEYQNSSRLRRPVTDSGYT
jgi:hypothetical protein